jgi:choline dehydrogenase
MIYIHGAAADYDAWEAMGCTGWGWRDLLPLFRNLETADAPDDTYRGGGGPQRVSQLRWRHRLAADFIASGVRAGIPLNEDLNGPVHEDIGWNQGSTIQGRRHSAYDAFLAPNRRRPNLSVLDDPWSSVLPSRDGGPRACSPDDVIERSSK